MPHKFNDARRYVFAKQRFRVTNWAEYNEALRRRGDLTIWFEEGVADLWSAPRRLTRGGQARYSDLAIEICLSLRLVFDLMWWTASAPGIAVCQSVAVKVT